MPTSLCVMPDRTLGKREQQGTQEGAHFLLVWGNSLSNKVYHKVSFSQLLSVEWLLGTRPFSVPVPPLGVDTSPAVPPLCSRPWIKDACPPRCQGDSQLGQLREAPCNGTMLALSPGPPQSLPIPISSDLKFSRSRLGSLNTTTSVN